MITRPKYLKVLKYFIILLLFSNVLRPNIVEKVPLIVLLFLCFFLITNDLIRNILKNYNIGYYFSLALSIVAAALLKYFVGSFLPNIYMFFYVIEILSIEGKSKLFF